MPRVPVWRTRLPVVFAGVTVVLAATFTSPPQAADAVGFQPYRPYNQGHTDSVVLFSLKPIASQPLSPNSKVTLSMAVTAYYAAFSWDESGSPAYLFTPAPWPHGVELSGDEWNDR